MDETLGQRLKRLRGQAGLSQDGLGQIAGIRGQSIYLLESGKTKRMNPGTAELLADALGVSTAYLEHGDAVIPSELPPLEDYLRRTTDISPEAARIVRRIVRAFQMEAQVEARDTPSEAERRLAIAAQRQARVAPVEAVAAFSEPEECEE